MKPVLLLVPGMLNDERVWEAVLPALRHLADVRVADVRTQPSIADMTQQAWSSLADVPATTPLCIAGFSMGGYVAIDMVANAPRPVQGLVLVSTSARPESAQASAVRTKTIAAMQADFPKVVAGLIGWNTHAPSPQLSETLGRMMLAQGAEVATRQMRAIMGRSDHRAVLAELDIPVHVLCGVHDRVTPPELAQELAQCIPGARLTLVEESGHMLPLEQPAALVAALSSLINNFFNEETT